MEGREGTIVSEGLAAAVPPLVRSPDALAQAVAEDQPEALTEAWRAYGGMVRAVAARILGRGHAGVADVEQATFLTLWQRRQALRTHPTLAGWCHTTALHIAQDVARQERRRTHRQEAAMTPPSSPTAADGLPGVDTATAAALDTAIERLPPASRAVVIGLFFTGEDRAVLATRLGISDVALRQRLSDGLARLRRALRPAVLPETALLALLQAPAPPAAPIPPVWLAAPHAASRPPAPALARLLPATVLAQRRLLLVVGASVLVAWLLLLGAWTRLGTGQPVATTRPGAPSGTTLPALLPAGPPVLLGAAQQAEPHGGLVVLWSRSRWGNYPLATYDFRSGLRGDHPAVANRVQLAFGNRLRAHAWQGVPVDAVPGTIGAGACGRDGASGGQEVDEFRAGLEGEERAAIRDCGTLPFDQLRVAVPLGFDAAYAPVVVGHTYLLQYHANGEPGSEVKFRVLAHRDNDVVLLEWAPLPLPLPAPRGLN